MNELPDRVDVHYEGVAFEYIPGKFEYPSVGGGSKFSHVAYIEGAVDIPIRMTCDYCRSTHNYLASNCRNCGAPL